MDASFTQNFRHTIPAAKSDHIRLADENAQLRAMLNQLRVAAAELDQNWQQYAINSELVFMYLTGNKQVQRQLTSWRYEEAREKSMQARKMIEKLRKTLDTVLAGIPVDGVTHCMPLPDPPSE